MQEGGGRERRKEKKLILYRKKLRMQINLTIPPPSCWGILLRVGDGVQRFNSWRYYMNWKPDMISVTILFPVATCGTTAK